MLCVCAATLVKYISPRITNVDSEISEEKKLDFDMITNVGPKEVVRNFRITDAEEDHVAMLREAANSGLGGLSFDLSNGVEIKASASKENGVEIKSCMSKKPDGVGKSKDASVKREVTFSR